MQWSSPEDLKAMTLQIGLVACDGLVLASDRLLQQFEYGSRSVGLVSKFLQGNQVTCCYSGDVISEYAANNVRDLDWRSIPNEKEAVRSHLISAGNEAWKRGEALMGSPVHVPRKVITAAHNTSLWLLDIGPQSIASQRLDRVVAGDAENTARYFMNKYAENCFLRPINELITLAAYTIVAGGEENPHGVSGLEVIVFPKGQSPLVLSDSQINKLTENAAGIIRSMASSLLTPFELS